jgi:hypothetical protein
MFELCLIASLSIIVLCLSYQLVKLQQKIIDLEFERFMKDINKELTSYTIEDHSIIERTLQ